VPFIVEVPDKVNDQGSHMLSLVSTLRQFVQWRKGDAVLLGEANVPPEENSSYFGKTGEGMNMIFNFYGNQYLFYGLATGDLRLLRRALQATKDIPPVSQWAWFLRMHDEIDLGRLTNEQRERVYQRMGPDKDMQLYNRGIRRRLAPMLHDSAELRLAYSLLFSMPGAPLIRYGEELGMGDDLRLKERLAVRTPMQWTNGKNAGFSTSDHIFRPVISTGDYGYEKVNEEDEDRDPNSLLNFIRRLIRLRKDCPEIGLGRWTIMDSTLNNVLVIRYKYEGQSLIVIHNFSDRPVKMMVYLPGDGGVLDLMTGEETREKDEDIDVRLGGYGFKWFRVTSP
jgi:maltose alpha-D-glucosyltransferase/alpha-amylase